MTLPLAFRLARRELRGGVRGLTIVLLCLALGVGVIAGVGSLRQAIDAGLAADGRALLGGDVEIEGGNTPIPEAPRQFLRDLGARTSDRTIMRSMMIAPSGERTLIELKAVDDAWPLAGTAAADPPQPIAVALAEKNGLFGLLANQLVLDRLGLKPGDTASLGAATFRVAGALTAEPDRVAIPAVFGPRVLISQAALTRTGLAGPGIMANFAVRAVVPTAGAAALPGAVRQKFGDQGWRIRDPADAAPSTRRFLDQTSQFLTLIGLTALLVGGIGVANGVSAWLDARGRTIATLRCLGAPSGLVFAMCLIQVMALALMGVALGLALGASVPFLARALPDGSLPVPPEAGIYPGPLLLALGFGLLTALCFALWPLGRAARIPGAALFRDLILTTGIAPGRGMIAANAVVAVALIGLTIGSAADRMFALYFCAGALATLGLFRLAAMGLMRLARTLPAPRTAWLKLGISALYRPGAATPLLMVSVGLGLSTLATVALTQHTIQTQILEQMPGVAPSFFFIDIQNDQMARFRDLADSVPNVTDIQDVPSLRARVVAIKGVPSEQADVTPETKFALQGDRGLTYAATPPAHTRLLAGAWWPADYAGPPLVSLDASLAKGWHVGVGDIVRVNVLGRDIDLRIASLREIAWQSLSINFFMVASPGLLSHAPHTHIATVRTDPAHEGQLLRTITDGLPNVTGVRVADVLTAVSELLGQVANALAATGLVTLLAGLLVLAGAVAAGQRRRTRDSIILRTVGATGAQLRAAWLVEFAAIGAASGLVAAFVGAAASFGIARFILHTTWSFSWAVLAATLIGGLATLLIFGYIGLAGASRARPAQLLRNE